MATQTTAIASRRSLASVLAGAPPQLFAIPMGLAGLASTWRTAAARVNAPALFANLIYLAAAIVAALLLYALVARLARAPREVLGELAHPVAAPFFALLPISGMLLTLGLAPYAPAAATLCFYTCLVGAWLFAAWLVGQWIVGSADANAIHPGYFLPTVGAGMIGADGLAQFGAPAAGWMSFGAGALCWALFGALILHRLLAGPPLPASLATTLAILLAPPAIAGSAYFALNGGKPDALAYGLAGCTALMALVQLRFVPLYRATPFGPGFWAFTFPSAALISYAHQWLAALKPGAAPIIAWALLMLLTGLVGTIAWHTLVALWRGEFLPS